jgi:hypothetical protein
MNQPPIETDPHGFTAAETRLLELAKALDEPVERDRHKLALVAMGQRSRTLFRASRQILRGRAAAAAPALLRPMVEINVLIRFFAKNPELHTELWEVEGERNVITMAREITGSPEMSERWMEYPLDMADFAERNVEVEKVRKKALEAGVRGVRETGPVLPSIVMQLQTIDEPDAYEEYTMVYRSLSWDVHGGARALLRGRFLEHSDRTVSYTEDADDTDPPRALAINTFASTLKLCSVHLSLGIEEDAEKVLRSFLPKSPDTPKRR